MTWSECRVMSACVGWMVCGQCGRGGQCVATAVGEAHGTGGGSVADASMAANLVKAMPRRQPCATLSHVPKQVTFITPLAAIYLPLNSEDHL